MYNKPYTFFFYSHQNGVHPFMMKWPWATYLCSSTIFHYLCCKYSSKYLQHTFLIVSTAIYYYRHTWPYKVQYRTFLSDPDQMENPSIDSSQVHSEQSGWRRSTSRSVWPDLANFRHFCNILKVFGQFLRLLFGIWQSFEPNFANLYAIGQIYIVIIAKLKNNQSIWSHWSRSSHSCR